MNSCSDCRVFQSPSPSSTVRRCRSRKGIWFLLPLLVASFMPCHAWATTFKIVLVGPWTCDLLYSKSLPDTVARLATTRINKDPHLNKGYWYDYTIVNEDCKSSRALARFSELKSYGAAFLGPANPGYCSSAALYAKQWDLGILSWGCLKPDMNQGGAYPTFLRPLPLSAHVLFTVLRFFRWAHVAVVSEETDVWEATGQELASSLRALGLPVHPVVTMENNEDGPRRALTKIREADRVRGQWYIQSDLLTLFVSVLRLIFCSVHSDHHVHAVCAHRRPGSAPAPDHRTDHENDRPGLRLYSLRHPPVRPAVQGRKLLRSGQRHAAEEGVRRRPHRHHGLWRT